MSLSLFLFLSVMSIFVDIIMSFLLYVSLKVVWGRISMIDAERRLLTSALRDPENQQFVLLSDR